MLPGAEKGYGKLIQNYLSPEHVSNPNTNYVYYTLHRGVCYVCNDIILYEIRYFMKFYVIFVDKTE
jgi:hypothetical protein